MDLEQSRLRAAFARSNLHGAAIAVAGEDALPRLAPFPRARAPAVRVLLAARAHAGRDELPALATSTPTVQDIMELGNFSPLEPGAYVIDPDGDPSTPLRVVYEIPVEGWAQGP